MTECVLNDGLIPADSPPPLESRRMDSEMCRNYCGQSVALITRYSETWFLCACTSTLSEAGWSQLEPSSCSKKCPGDPFQMCGSYYAWSVYPPSGSRGGHVFDKAPATSVQVNENNEDTGTSLSTGFPVFIDEGEAIHNADVSTAKDSNPSNPNSGSRDVAGPQKTLIHSPNLQSVVPDPNDGLDMATLEPQIENSIPASHQGPPVIPIITTTSTSVDGFPKFTGSASVSATPIIPLICSVAVIVAVLVGGIAVYRRRRHSESLIPTSNSEFPTASKQRKERFSLTAYLSSNSSQLLPPPPLAIISSTSQPLRSRDLAEKNHANYNARIPMQLGVMPERLRIGLQGKHAQTSSKSSTHSAPSNDDVTAAGDWIHRKMTVDFDVESTHSSVSSFDSSTELSKRASSLYMDVLAKNHVLEMGPAS